MRRSDVLKILFVCVCVCHVVPAHPCGENPLRLVDNFSRTRGFDPETMLAYLRKEAPSEYGRLMQDYRVYLDCMQMVHTGYFKRSVDMDVDENEAPAEIENDDTDGNGYKTGLIRLLTDRLNSRKQKFLSDKLNTFPEKSGIKIEMPVLSIQELPNALKRYFQRKASKHIPEEDEGFVTFVNR